MIFPFGPLSIVVKDNGRFPSFSAEVVENLVIPHLPRTRTLTLNLRPNGYPQFFRAPPESFSSLKVLDLKFGLYRFSESIIQAFQNTTIFNQAQALRKLKLISTLDTSAIARLSENIVAIPVPWHQLTELDLGLSSLDLATVHRLLQQCTNLQAFYVTICENISETSMKDLILPYLWSLTI